MADYSKIPAKATLKPIPFIAHIPDGKLKLMKDLVALSPIGPAVFENTSTFQGESVMSSPSRKYGMRRDYLIAAKERWLHSFDWRKQEQRINSFPNFTVPVTGDDGVEFEIHFLALFSEREDAVPIAFYHGWPGSFLEFLKIATLLRERYTAAELPYHVIVPSLPGYAYSSGPPDDLDYSVKAAANVLHKLMLGLGFSSYLAQGGDIGSIVARFQATGYDECKSMHLNALIAPSGLEKENLPMTDNERNSLVRGEAFSTTGRAYALMHGTRTATIGLALSASPLALLCWIGEKFLEWSDVDPSLDEILASVSLYWLTETFPRCIYPYRGDGASRTWKEDKPSGYSFFPKELGPVPLSWARESINVVAFKEHLSGGHFAAMEKPEELLADVEEWVKVW